MDQHVDDCQGKLETQEELEGGDQVGFECRCHLKLSGSFEHFLLELEQISLYFLELQHERDILHHLNPQQS